MEVPPPFEPRKLHRLARNPLVTLVAALPFALAALVAATGTPVQALPWLVAGVWAQVLARRSNPLPRRRGLTVAVDERGLRLAGKHVPLDRIRSALVVPVDGKLEARVRVEGKGPGLPVELETRDVGEARELVRALGRDPSRATADFLVGSAAMGNVRRMLGAAATVVLPAVLVFGIALLLDALALAPFLPLAGMLAFVGLFFLPSRLVVGADGFSLRWLLLRRFVSWAEVDRVTRLQRPRVDGLFVLLRSGETIALPMGTTPWESASPGAVDERIEEALASFRQGDAGAAASALARGDRAVGAWVTALRALGAGANAGPREAPVPRDRLWRIVEDPRADDTARAAAAVALGGAGEGEERVRLRGVAEATVEPRLRAAIAAAAEEEGVALEEALAALSDERVAKRA